MSRSATGESVLTRAVRVIEAFTPEEPELSISEIARRSRLHVATASRIVGQLAEHGLLTREADRRVRIGMRMWELASRASPTRTLRDAAMPYMEDLHAVVGHHVQLAVLDGDEVIILERLSSRGAVVNYSRIAGRLPLHCTSTGTVLLAYAPEAMRERVLSEPMSRYTPATITSPDRLRKLLAQARGDGYVMLAGHVHENAAGIAAPVRDALGRVVAALAVIVPNDDRAASAVPAVLAAARGIRRSATQRVARPSEQHDRSGPR